MNPDAFCLSRGVTTAVDAGSAGATTIKGLIQYGANRNRTRLLAFLHVTLHGLASAGCAGGGTGGELDSLKQVSVRDGVAAAKAYPDHVVGFKVIGLDTKPKAECIQTSRFVYLLTVLMMEKPRRRHIDVRGK